MISIVQSEAVPATERDNWWYLLDLIFFPQLTDTDRRINKTVKELSAIYGSQLPFFFRSNVSFYIMLFLIYG